MSAVRDPQTLPTPTRGSGRFLITTALEETWRSDQPILWLGEWCRRYSRQAHWSRLNGLVLPYHWDNRLKMHADYRRLHRLHERLLPVLASQLNEIHGTDHGCRYWRILIGPWLGYFTQMLFDRWCSIQQALEHHRINETVVLTSHENRLVPVGMDHFLQLFVGDEWNHHLYAIILQEFTRVRCTCVKRVSGDRPAARTTWRQQLEPVAIRTYARVAGYLAGDTDAFFLSTYLPRGTERRLCRRLGQPPLRWPSMTLAEAAVDDNRRRWELGPSHSDFEACLNTLIPRQIPTAYLEGYGRLVEQTEHLPWPRQPKLIWTSNAHSSDDVFKAWAAQKVEEGTPFVIGQHGGGYGTWKWSFVEDHEVAICDHYLSWGWSDPSIPKIKPVGQFNAGTKLRAEHSIQPRALMVGVAPPRYSYFMYSMPVARQWLDYDQEQATFVERLPDAIRDVLTVRLYPQDYGWDQADRWRDRFPQLRLDDGQRPIDDLMGESRLCINTYNATGYLETFARNIPTILFWNPDHWEIRSAAVPYFEELRRAGILHYSPESAADHVTAIWDEVDSWWTSSGTQAALEHFTSCYSHSPREMLDRLESVLREVEASPDEATLDALV